MVAGEARYFLIIPLVFLFVFCSSLLIDLSAQALYAIKSGDWDDPTVWSDASGGGTCNCIPNPGNDVHISEGIQDITVNMNFHGDVGSITIYAGGKLNWTGNYTLSVFYCSCSNPLNRY